MKACNGPAARSNTDYGARYTGAAADDRVRENARLGGEAAREREGTLEESLDAGVTRETRGYANRPASVYATFFP